MSLREGCSSVRRQRGAALLEFSFVLIPFLLLTFGCILYGLVFVSQQALAFAAQRGADAIVKIDAHSSAVTGSDGSLDLATYCALGEGLAAQRVAQVLPPLGLLNGVAVDTAPSQSVDGSLKGCRITVSKQFPLAIPLIPLPATIRGMGFAPAS